MHHAGVWGGKGQGKTFQTELIFKAMGVEPVIMSAGELESERAGQETAELFYACMLYLLCRMFMFPRLLVFRLKTETYLSAWGTFSSAESQSGTNLQSSILLLFRQN